MTSQPFEQFAIPRPLPYTDPELRALINQLTDRVIAAESARTDAEDLRRENADLHAALAGTDTTPEAIARLRKWVPDYAPGASFVAMPTVMAQKILAELDRLSANRLREITDRGITTEFDEGIRKDAATDGMLFTAGTVRLLLMEIDELRHALGPRAPETTTKAGSADD